MLCSHCQRENPPQNAFCHACGTPLAVLAAPVPARSPAVKALAAEAAAPIAQRPVLSAAAVARAKGAAPTCRRCSGKGDPNARFCKFCGSPFDEPAAPVSEQAFQAVVAPPPNPPLAAQQPGAAVGARVVIILRDGSEGVVYPLEAPHTDVGSREGAIVLSDDPYLSPRHARLERRDDTFVLRDLDSVNGVYARLREPFLLSSGDMFLIGQQVLRFEVLSEAERRVGPAKQHGVMVFGTPELPRLARVVQYTTEGLARDVYHLYRDETVFGREQADVVFAEDPFMSRRHAVIFMDRERARFTLRDLGSSNGTAVRVSEQVLHHGDQFRLGRHLFRFDLTAGGGRADGEGIS
jgi:pSer/pThr/pTyr-binding forkhead associated (FHA) protein